MFLDQDVPDGSLASVFCYLSPEDCNHYRYVLTREDLGELACATRRVIGEGWILYESRQSYIDHTHPDLGEAVDNANDE